MEGDRGAEGLGGAAGGRGRARAMGESGRVWGGELASGGGGDVAGVGVENEREAAEYDSGTGRTGAEKEQEGGKREQKMGGGGGRGMFVVWYHTRN